MSNPRTIKLGVPRGEWGVQCPVNCYMRRHPNLTVEIAYPQNSLRGRAMRIFAVPIYLRWWRDPHYRALKLRKMRARLPL